MAILLLRLFLPPLISPLALWSRTLTEALPLLPPGGDRAS